METKENKRQHMEFLQNVITRMNSNSFAIKGWAVALISAIFALSAKDAQYSFIYIAGLVLPVFWCLDAYYLSQERRYRAYYDDVRAKDETAIDFNMSLPDNTIAKNGFTPCLLSDTIAPLYIFMSLIAILVYLILKQVIKW
jgi:hypothetical protein